MTWHRTVDDPKGLRPTTEGTDGLAAMETTRRAGARTEGIAHRRNPGALLSASRSSSPVSKKVSSAFAGNLPRTRRRDGSPRVRLTTVGRAHGRRDSFTS